MKNFKYILIIFLVGFGSLYIYVWSMNPSLDKNWEIDQKILTDVEINNDIISLKNIRNFKYTSPSEYIPDYYDADFNIDDVISVDYIIEPFGEVDGFAHTMLSFGFTNERYLTVSAEIRKEVGESFHPISGLLNAYEIVYIIGDERDLIKLRANHRKDTVILYPIKASPQEVQDLFISVMRRAESLATTPEFYNTLTKTCSTSILSHLNELRTSNNKSPIEWSKAVLLPSYSDEIAYNLGLIDTDLSLTEAREYYTINGLSEQYTGDENYSTLIRKEKR